MRGSRRDEAFDRAFSDLFRAAREIAYRILGDHHAADNVAAETMAGAFARWRRLRSPVDAMGWVVRRSAEIAIDAAPPPGALEPEVLNEALGPALAALPRHQALAVALRFLSTLGPAQVATALRRSRAQVDTDVSAALPRLARQLGPLADELPATTPMEAIPSRSDTTKVLHRVHARGLYLRRQPITFGLFLTLAALLAAGIAGVVSTNGDSGSKLQVIAAPTSTTPTTEPVTTTLPPDTTVPPATTTSAVPGATPTTLVTATTVHTTTTAGCQNSTNPACGPFRWSPSPNANQPLSFDGVVVSPPNPQPGDKVTFKVTFRDPDDSVNSSGSCHDLNLFGDENGTMPGGCGPCPSAGRYGPWAPPAPSSGSRVDYPFHVYSGEGTFTATFKRSSGDPCPAQSDPYASDGSQSVTVKVLVHP